MIVIGGRPPLSAGPFRIVTTQIKFFAMLTAPSQGGADLDQQCRDLKMQRDCVTTPVFPRAFGVCFGAAV